MNSIIARSIEHTNPDITEARASLRYIETLIEIYSKPNRKIPTLVQQILDNNQLPNIYNIPYPFRYHIDQLGMNLDLLDQGIRKIQDIHSNNEFLSLLHKAMIERLRGSRIV